MSVNRFSRNGSAFAVTLIGLAGFLADACLRSGWCDESSSFTQAIKSAGQPIEIDFEVWECDDADPEQPVLGMTSLRLFHEFQRTAPDSECATRHMGSIRVKAADGAVVRQRLKFAAGSDEVNNLLDSGFVTVSQKQELELAITPKLDHQQTISLEYEFIRRDATGEMKEVGARQIELGKMAEIKIKPKDAKYKFKNWLVFAYPRVKTSDGKDVTVHLTDAHRRPDFALNFCPRPGRFEICVQEGWAATLSLPAENGRYMPIVFSGSTNVGTGNSSTAEDAKDLKKFVANDPVLQVVRIESPAVQLIAIRPGVATLRYECMGTAESNELCELTVRVRPDTSEIDQAISDNLPNARIKVSKVQQAGILAGTVEEPEDVAFVLEIASQFFPSVINRLRIEKAAASPGRLPDKQSQNDALRRTAHDSAIKSADDKLKPRSVSGESNPHDAQRILDEIRSLRQEVKKLTELVEQKLADKEPKPEVEPSPPSNAKGVSADTVLFFFANWCGPCQEMKPMVERLVRAGFPIEIVDIDQNKKLADRYKVTSIPQVIFISECEPVERLIGKTSIDRLRDLFQEFDIYPSVAAHQIEESLLKSVTLQCQDTRFYEILRQLESQIGVNIVVDETARMEAGVSLFETVSIDLDRVTARSALKLLLRPLALAYEVRDDVIVVTSQARAVRVVLYSVGDLLTARGVGFECELQDLITKTVAPESWKSRSAGAYIRFDADSQRLEIRQTRRNHERIADLLEQMRQVSNVRKAKTDSPTTSQNGDAKWAKTKVESYLVGDLLIPFPMDGKLSEKQLRSKWLALIDRITAEIDPSCWDVNGGECSIRSNEQTLALIIRTSDSTHERIHSLLKKLRSEVNLPIAFHTQILYTPDEAIFRQAGLPISMDEKTQSMTLDTNGAHNLVTAVAAKGEVVEIPRITTWNGVVFDGQCLLKQSKPVPVPIPFFLRGAIAHDIKTIHLNVAVNPQNVVDELSKHSHQSKKGECLLLDMTKEFQRGRTPEPNERLFVLISAMLPQEEEETLETPTATGPVQDAARRAEDDPNNPRSR